MESFFSSLKQELTHHERFASLDDDPPPIAVPFESRKSDLLLRL
ncbi:hypothetical protein [Xanthomonas translucens]|nr:hypothetical protein [Xanthomonas translucens]